MGASFCVLRGCMQHFGEELNPQNIFWVGWVGGCILFKIYLHIFCEHLKTLDKTMEKHPLDTENFAVSPLSQETCLGFTCTLT